MFSQESHSVGKTFIGDALDLGVNFPCCGFAVGSRQSETIARTVLPEREWSDFGAHPPSHHHLVSNHRDLLQVARRARGQCVVDQLLRRPAAEGAHDPSAHVILAIVEAIVDRALDCDSQCSAMRNYRHFADGVRTGYQQAQEGMPRLVIGDTFAVAWGQHQVTLGSKQNPVDGLEKVSRGDGRLALASGAEGRLVGEVAEIGTHQPGGGTGDRIEVDVGAQWHLCRVNFQNRGAAAPVRRLERHTAIEATGPKEGLVENIRPVGCSQDDDSFPWLEPIHFRKDLVERLFLFIVATDAKAGATATADGVKLVEENDRGRGLARLCEQIPHARGADANNCFHELRCGLAEEGHLCLARDGASQQSLAGAWRPDKENALRDHSAEALIFLRLP